MMHIGSESALTRQGFLTLTAGVGIAPFSRLYGFSSDFWNKKEPSQWSSAEIEQLTSKSPWAKEASGQYQPEPGGDMGGPRSGGGGYPGGGYPGGGYPGGGMGGPRIGGMGIPGMGGGMGRGRNRGGGQRAESIKGTVRWESARPVMEAMKTPLPEAFAGHYVISVSGFPLYGGRHRRSQDDSEENAPPSADDMLDRLKSLTLLEPKGREGVQPGVVQQQPSSGAGSILFGFSKELLALKPDDKEVTFSTRLGRLTVKAKFNLKDMMYHGELAV